MSARNRSSRMPNFIAVSVLLSQSSALLPRRRRPSWGLGLELDRGALLPRAPAGGGGEHLGVGIDLHLDLELPHPRLVHDLLVADDEVDVLDELGLVQAGHELG